MSATDSNESRFNIAPVFRRARLVRILFEFGVGILFLKSSTLAADNFSFELAEDQFPVLEQVLSEAAAESPLMLEEALRIRSAKAEERIAASGRLPSVSASFRYLGRIEDRSDLAGTRNYLDPQATLTARQPIYRWGALNARREAGEIGTELAELNRAELYQKLALQIRADFLNLAIRRHRIDLAEKKLDLVRKETKSAERRLERNEATAEEIEILQLSLEEAAVHLDRERKGFQFAIERFRQFSGFSPEGVEWIPETISKLRSEEFPLLKTNKGESISERISELRIERAEKELIIESARQKPRIDLIAGVSQDQLATFDRSDVGQVVYFGGIELTWNLFDGFETAGRREAAQNRRALEVRRQNREAGERELEMQRLFRNLTEADAELGFAEKHLEIAGRELAQVESDLEKGVVSSIDLAKAEVTFAERELVAVLRRSDVLMAIAEMLAAAGADPAMSFLE